MHALSLINYILILTLTKFSWSEKVRSNLYKSMAERDTLTSPLRGPGFDLQPPVQSVFALPLLMWISSRYPGFFPQPTDIQSGGLGILNFPQERMGARVCLSVNLC